MKDIGKEKEKIIEVIGEYEGMEISQEKKVKEKMIEEEKKMKVVGREGIGVENVDIKEDQRRGIIVMNKKLGNQIKKEEKDIEMMLDVERKLKEEEK